MDEPHRRKAANEAVFREVNEQIAGIQERYAVTDQEPLMVICECDRIGCADHLSVPYATYERVRGDGACFVVVPGHEDRDVEDVDRSGGYLVVRKKPGEPRRVAEETDPRR